MNEIEWNSDDVVIIIQGKDTRIVRELVQTELKSVLRSCGEVNLAISAEKIAILAFNRKRLTE